MPTRSITLAGRRWQVMPSGRVTQYDRDEFALLFDVDLARLFEQSQPGDTSPEAGYIS